MLGAFFFIVSECVQPDEPGVAGCRSFPPFPHPRPRTSCPSTRSRCSPPPTSVQVSGVLLKYTFLLHTEKKPLL